MNLFNSPTLRITWWDPSPLGLVKIVKISSPSSRPHSPITPFSNGIYMDSTSIADFFIWRGPITSSIRFSQLLRTLLKIKFHPIYLMVPKIMGSEVIFGLSCQWYWRFTARKFKFSVLSPGSTLTLSILGQCLLLLRSILTLGSAYEDDRSWSSEVHDQEEDEDDRSWSSQVHDQVKFTFFGRSWLWGLHWFKDWKSQLGLLYLSGLYSKKRPKKGCLALPRGWKIYCHVPDYLCKYTWKTSLPLLLLLLSIFSLGWLFVLSISFTVFKSSSPDKHLGSTCFFAEHKDLNFTCIRGFNISRCQILMEWQLTVIRLIPSVKFVPYVPRRNQGLVLFGYTNTDLAMCTKCVSCLASNFRILCSFLSFPRVVTH